MEVVVHPLQKISYCAAHFQRYHLGQGYQIHPMTPMVPDAAKSSPTFPLHLVDECQ
jgi:hypothetical protein